MDLFETGGFAIPRCREPPLVPTPPLCFLVLHADIADLKNPHRHRMPFVLPYRLQQAWKQAGPHNLVLGGLRVLQADRFTVVFAVQPGVVLIVRAEDQGQDFRPPGHGCFQANNVCQLVDWERGGNTRGRGREVARQIVEPVGYRGVFHDVGLVQDVGTRDRDVDVEHIRVGLRGFGRVAHFLEAGGEFFAGKGETTDAVDEVGRGLGGARGQVGRLPGLVVVRRGDGHGFDGEGFGAVLREHGADDLVYQFELSFVGGSDVDEDIGRVEGDFRVVAVDYGGHGEDLAVLVVDDWVDGGVADDGEEFGEVLVFLW